MWKYRLLCPLAGKPQTMGDGEPRAPSLLVSGGGAGEEKLSQGLLDGDEEAGFATCGVEARDSQKQPPTWGLPAICPFSIACVFFTFPPLLCYLVSPLYLQGLNTQVSGTRMHRFGFQPFHILVL